MATLSFSLWGYRFVDGWQFDFYSDVLHRLGFTVLPFVLISVLTLLIAAAVLSRHEALAQENRLAALREVYYTGLQQEQIQLRTLRHDLCNHVTALQGLLEQGREGDAVRYLAELSDSPALGSGKRYTANETANVVLASKAAIMAAAGLVADFSVWVPARLSIPAPELCALLGNALDNAIEGAANAKNRVVCLRLRVEKGLFMLQVQNAVGGTIMPDLSTTKPNGERHGLGLAGMRDIVRRHSGTLETTIENGQFELMVCFPCNEP